MAENYSDIKEKLKQVFGDEEVKADEASEENDVQESSSEASENQATEPAEGTSEQKNETVTEAEASRMTLEDRIRSIRENAMNTYAKETDDTVEKSAEVTEGDNTEEAADLQNTAGETNEQESSDAPDCGKTKDYNMSELIKVLQYGNSDSDDSDDSDDEEEPKKKRKKSKKTDFTDETDIGVYDSELYDDVNEYHHDFEFTEKVQGAELFRSFRKSAVVSCLFAALTFLVTVLCVWFEIGHGAGLPFSNAMNAGRYGRVFAMVCLEMLALCVFFNLDGLARGIRKMSLKHPAPEALAVVSTVVCAIHTVITAAVAHESTSYRTFCFVGCVMLFMLSVNTFIKSYTRFKAFAMVMAKKPKLATKKLDFCSEEHNVFAKYLSEDSDVLAVSKTDSVSGFIKRTYTVPAATGVFNMLMYVVLAVSVAVGIVSAVMLEAGAYEAVTNAAMVFLMSCPVSCLAVTAIPYFVTSIRVNKMRSAILGEAACDYYENTGVLSFDDTEVFPPKAVKVTSIKTFNDNRIDKVIVYMAKIFNKLGGPLSYVFASSLQGTVSGESEIMVVETSADGLHVKIDDDDILVGTAKYLRMYDVEAPVDPADETEMRSLTSIVYLVSNNQLAAKFYIRYALNRGFEPVLKGMYDAGVCCGVRTADPGVDNQLVSGNLKGTNYPISVISKEASDIDKKEDTVETGLIGVSGIHSFLKSFILLDKLRVTYKTNSVFGILGAIIGLAISTGLIFVNSTVLPSVMLLFQLVWLIPMILVSVFSK